MKKAFISLYAVIVSLAASAEITIDRCLELARENYPLIKKQALIPTTEDIDLSDINKGWLPRIGVYAQGSIQNVVPSFPSSLTDMMNQMGNDFVGLGKLQYKVGVDINQTVWDGGASKGRREIAKSRTGVNEAALEVDLYAIRRRVQSYFFAILLIESQIEQTESVIKVYESNLQQLNSMKANGVAMQSDVDMVEAQLLAVRQQLTQARAAVKGYRKALSLFVGEDLSQERLTLPSAEVPTDLNPDRPELSLFNSRMALNNARRTMNDVSLMPRIGLFAQSYYGYPGIDYFKAMTSRNLTFNIVAGLRISWNIDSFYTKKNSSRRLDIANSEIEADRETFLFNTSLQSASQLEEIRGIASIMQDDDRIVSLRRKVRLAAESQLHNGIIDTTALITKINDETQASLSSAYHKIQYIQAIYNLKNTLNR